MRTRGYPGPLGTAVPLSSLLPCAQRGNPDHRDRPSATTTGVLAPARIVRPSPTSSARHSQQKIWSIGPISAASTPYASQLRSSVLLGGTSWPLITKIPALGKGLLLNFIGAVVITGVCYVILGKGVTTDVDLPRQGSISGCAIDALPALVASGALNTRGYSDTPRASVRRFAAPTFAQWLSHKMPSAAGPFQFPCNHCIAVD